MDVAFSDFVNAVKAKQGSGQAWRFQGLVNAVKADEKWCRLRHFERPGSQTSSLAIKPLVEPVYGCLQFHRVAIIVSNVKG